mmetsp:Transcript_3834/g.11640  ORF Transcript_3834/g.11640 Transcript_3834/m.11640 type:complete len:200 (-) Transcript_3834:348-947(-)
MPCSAPSVNAMGCDSEPTSALPYTLITLKFPNAAMTPKTTDVLFGLPMVTDVLTNLLVLGPAFTKSAKFSGEELIEKLVKNQALPCAPLALTSKVVRAEFWPEAVRLEAWPALASTDATRSPSRFSKVATMRCFSSVPVRFTERATSFSVALAYNVPTTESSPTCLLYDNNPHGVLVPITPKNAEKSKPLPSSNLVKFT